MGLKGQDFLYVGLGLGALFLILKNSRPIGETIAGASGVVNPLLSAAGKGAQILTNPESYKSQSYTLGLLNAPFNTSQAWALLKQQPGLPELTNAIYTTMGLWK